ncbi:MAG: glycerol-3-phosphate acyltransferase [Dehalococcoidia bacterium]
MTLTVLLTASAFFLGSIPTAYLLVWTVKRRDIRALGSGSISASNVSEVLGPWATALVGVSDILKGAAPIWAAQELDRSLAQQMTVGLGVLAGHNWSVFMGFRGGRGLSVVVGVLLAVARLELLLFVIIAVFGYAFTGSAPIWLGLATALLPFWSYALGREAALIWGNGIMVALVVLKRLLGNWDPLPERGKARVLLYRFILDRDTRDRRAWVRRGTSGEEPASEPGP